MFDVAKFSLYLKAQQEEYMKFLLEITSRDNPSWIKNLQNDVDLFNSDGTPKDVDKELIDKKIQELLSILSPPMVDRETVYKYFVVDKEIIDKFIME